jgi:1,4-dihydroxy-2-naphthoate octaprenyltransferase
VAAWPERWIGDDWWKVPLLSVPSFLFIASILTVNNCCDREGDTLAHRKTIAILWGPKANLLIILLPLLAYLALGVLAGFDVIPRTFFVAVIGGPALTIPAWRGMFRRGFSHTTKGPNMGAVTQAFLIYTLVSILAWISGIGLR